MFDILIFLIIFEKNQQTTKIMKNYPLCNESNSVPGRSVVDSGVRGVILLKSETAKCGIS